MGDGLELAAFLVVSVAILAGLVAIAIAGAFFLYKTKRKGVMMGAWRQSRGLS